MGLGKKFRRKASHFQENNWSYGEYIDECSGVLREQCITFNSELYLQCMAKAKEIWTEVKNG